MSCRSSTHTRESRRTPSLRTGLIALAFVLVGVPVVSVCADEALDARARDVLAAHCASCREISGNGTATDLAAIARNPMLIRPGNPDGSPAYTAMLRRFDSGNSGPSAHDLGVLRTWIESLPPEAATCPSATFVARERIEAELARVATTQKKPVSAFRVLSLAHLHLGCAAPEQRAEWRQLLELILAAVANRSHPAPTHTLDAEGGNLAVDIQELGWDAHQWRSVLGIKSQIRRTTGPLIVRGDQLAAQVLRGEFGIMHAGPSGPVPAHLTADYRMHEADRETARAILGSVAPPDKLDRFVELMLRLAREHLALAGLPQVAAELGLRPDALASALKPEAGGDRFLLRRLIYGTIPRHEVEDNWTLIARLVRGSPPSRAMPLVPLEATRPPITPATPIELTLYPDRPHYAAGDSVKLTIRSNVDCYLTVISIDAGGFGTVIFPNDFVPKNRISAHLSVEIPAAGARYRFRVKDKGRERIVALCTPMDGTVDGIRYDFERQRFQELGPYSAFLDAALRRSPSPEVERDEREGLPAVPQSQIWRTGIVLEIR
jgi:hypothetical protein